MKWHWVNSLVIAALGVAGVVVGGGDWALRPAAAAPPPQVGHKDFAYTTLGKTAFIEHQAFSGATEQLDGPAREAMHRGMWAVTGDSAGNLFFYDIASNCIRALRKRDGRMFTLSGTRYITSGMPGKSGTADGLRLYHQCFITMPSLAAVGDPLNGTGSLYVSDDSGAVIRLWRAQGVWRYERVAGLGKGKPAPGAVATEIGFARSALVASAKGEIGLIAGSDKSAALYWLCDGKLAPAYDHTFVEKQLGTTFYCRGVDSNGNFVGAAGGEYTAALSCIVVVGSDGKTVRKVTTPYSPQWTISPDYQRDRWFFRACDDYTIQYVDRDGQSFRLRRDGHWESLTAAKGNSGSPKGLNWSRGTTLPDGRYAGWNGAQQGSPIFTATWLDGKE